jgi:hypothetical protein
VNARELADGDALSVPVTAAHIASGIRADAARCPVALALKDATGAQDVRADIITPRLEFPGFTLWLYTRDARRFMIAFDKGSPVTPASFTFIVTGRSSR